MQILINGRFLSRPVTGVERYALDISALLLKHRPEAFFIVPERVRDVPTKRTIRTGTGDGHFWEQTTLARESRKSDLLVNLANTGPLMGGKQIVTIHDMAFWHHPEWYKKGFARVYKELIPRLVRQAAHIITVSEHSKRDICRTLIVDRSKVSVVPPYTNFHGYHEQSQGVDRPYFLMVGSLDPRKNIRLAIEAFLHSNQGQMDLVIVGRKVRHFNHQKESFNEPRVKFLEHVGDTQLEMLYRGATALISTSLFEGFGLPVLEAMSYGTPVIASDIEVYREQFGDAPYYVDPTNKEEISHAMDRFATHFELGRFHARKGKILAAGYTPERSWECLKRVLEVQLTRV